MIRSARKLYTRQTEERNGMTMRDTSTLYPTFHQFNVFHLQTTSTSTSTAKCNLISAILLVSQYAKGITYSKRKHKQIRTIINQSNQSLNQFYSRQAALSVNTLERQRGTYTRQRDRCEQDNNNYDGKQQTEEQYKPTCTRDDTA